MSSDKFDLRILELVNEERAKVGADPLQIDSQLDQAADLHTDEMVQANYISHRLPGEPWLEERIKATGYELAEPTDSIPYQSDENVAYLQGYDDNLFAEQVVKAWMDSSGHRANILNSDYTHTGIGYGNINDSDDTENYDFNSPGDLGDVTSFYTQVFATPESVDV